MLPMYLWNGTGGVMDCLTQSTGDAGSPFVQGRLAGKLRRSVALKASFVLRGTVRLHIVERTETLRPRLESCVEIEGYR